MKKMVILLSFLLSVQLSGQRVFPPPNCDFQYHDINNIKFAVGNIGSNDAGYVGVGGIPYTLIYPKSSNNTFLAWSGFWLAAVVGGDTLASISAAYDAQGSPGGSIHEFYPDFRASDVVYRMSMFEKQDPDIDPNLVTSFFNNDGTLSEEYYPISHDDLICQYYDNKVLKNLPEAPETMKLHTPMNAHVIQRSFAWDNEWYSNIIFMDYFVINEHDSAWKDVHFGVYADPHCGDFSKGVTISDDISYWDELGRLLVQGDHVGTGGDDLPGGALTGWKILGVSKPGVPNPIEGLNTRFWSWVDGPNDPHFNEDYYFQISKNEIDRTYGPDNTGSMRGLYANGPIPELASGDTLRFTAALVGGLGIEKLRENMKAAQNLYSAGFSVPRSPNPPQFEVEAINNGVKIDWSWKDYYEGYNPVESVDNSRNDGIINDFDGFKVYRSEKGKYGPWNLIAQYDSTNGYGYDTGLKFSHTDRGLKNGLMYYYTVTAIDIRDDSSGIGPLESPKSFMVKNTMPGPKPEESGDNEVFVVPNPYRADVDYSASPAWEYPTQELRDDWYEIDRRIAFMNLPADCRVQIFTINGILVNKFEHHRDEKGHNIASWNLLNTNNHAVGSGIYYFVVEGLKADKNFKQVGKCVIVK
ncbi:MAG: hypothetical protein JXQ65_00865 [Candidatus Marinimicrobia bacterium]|nr:hypothetical protein [Candidatus Neomarinimicrobiota bacterium]